MRLPPLNYSLFASIGKIQKYLKENPEPDNLYSAEKLKEIFGGVAVDVVDYLEYHRYAVFYRGDIYKITPDAVDRMRKVARRGQLDQLKASWGWAIQWILTITANVAAFIALCK